MRQAEQIQTNPNFIFSLSHIPIIQCQSNTSHYPGSNTSILTQLTPKSCQKLCDNGDIDNIDNDSSSQSRMSGVETTKHIKDVDQELNSNIKNQNMNSNEDHTMENCIQVNKDTQIKQKQVSGNKNIFSSLEKNNAQNQKYSSCLLQIQQQYSSVLDFEGITQELIESIGKEIIRLTTQWQKKNINTLNKQFQNSVMNYFLECYVSELLVNDFQVEFKRDVFKQLTNKMEREEGAQLKKRYITLLNYFLDSISDKGKISKYLELLLHIIHEQIQTEKDTIDYQTQFRKKMTAILLLEHCLHPDRKTKFTDFYTLWSHVFTFYPLKRKKSKITQSKLRRPEFIITHKDQSNSAKYDEKINQKNSLISNNNLLTNNNSKAVLSPSFERQQYQHQGILMNSDKNFQLNSKKIENLNGKDCIIGSKDTLCSTQISQKLLTQDQFINLFTPINSFNISPDNQNGSSLQAINLNNIKYLPHFDLQQKQQLNSLNILTDQQKYDYLIRTNEYQQSGNSIPIQNQDLITTSFAPELKKFIKIDDMTSKIVSQQNLGKDINTSSFQQPNQYNSLLPQQAVPLNQQQQLLNQQLQFNQGLTNNFDIGYQQEQQVRSYSNSQLPLSSGKSEINIMQIQNFNSQQPIGQQQQLQQILYQINQQQQNQQHSQQDQQNLIYNSQQVNNIIPQQVSNVKYQPVQLQQTFYNQQQLLQNQQQLPQYQQLQQNIQLFTQKPIQQNQNLLQNEQTFNQQLKQQIDLINYPKQQQFQQSSLILNNPTNNQHVQSNIQQNNQHINFQPNQSFTGNNQDTQNTPQIQAGSFIQKISQIDIQQLQQQIQQLQKQQQQYNMNILQN